MAGDGAPTAAKSRAKPVSSPDQPALKQPKLQAIMDGDEQEAEDMAEGGSGDHAQAIVAPPPLATPKVP